MDTPGTGRHWANFTFISLVEHDLVKGILSIGQLIIFQATLSKNFFIYFHPFIYKSIKRINTKAWREKMKEEKTRCFIN